MADEMLCDCEAMRRSAGVEMGDDRIFDETTIFNFRHLLERHGMTKAILAEVSAHLTDKWITLRLGNLADATIIDVPSSTKNKARTRDPDMSTTRKGNDRYFGMKTHIGVGAESGMIQSLEVTTAKVHDNRVGYELLHGEETSVEADKGDISAEREAECSMDGKAGGVMRKVPQVVHFFWVTKRQFGHVKTRYRGLVKNRSPLSLCSRSATCSC